MLLYSQTIYGPDGGTVSVSNCQTREDAVRKTVSMAINAGWKPPKLWQFWRPKWDGDCLVEYLRQTGQLSPLTAGRE